MAKNKVKRDNYITIQGWQVLDLGLKGNELLVYAIIYGFSQDGENCFEGSLQYLADWTNSSKRSVMNVLKSLTEKKLITKTDIVMNGVKFCKYKATPLENLNNTMEKSSMGGMEKSSMGGMEKSSPNNIELNNIDINNINNTIGKRKENTLTLFEQLKDDYTLGTNLKEKIREWLKYKQERKEQYKETGLKSLLKQIQNKACTYGETAVCNLIDDCMANNWKGIIWDRLNQQGPYINPKVEVDKKAAEEAAAAKKAEEERLQREKEEHFQKLLASGALDGL